MLVPIGLSKSMYVVSEPWTVSAAVIGSDTTAVSAAATQNHPSHAKVRRIWPARYSQGREAGGGRTDA